MEADNTAAPPFEVHTLQDAAGQPKKRFTGKHLAHVSTGEHRNLPRWLTLDLYLKQDGTYILHRIGYSVVYHSTDPNSPCEGGERMSFKELLKVTDDGEACPKCRPMPFATITEAVAYSEAGQVLLEHNYYKVVELPDVVSIVRALEFVPKNSTTGVKTISRPGTELLLRASAYDPRIAELEDVVQDI